MRDSQLKANNKTQTMTTPTNRRGQARSVPATGSRICEFFIFNEYVIDLG